MSPAEERFYKHFDLNALGLLLASKKAASYFGSEGGSIINISSAVSTFTPPNSAVYTATKGAGGRHNQDARQRVGARAISG